MNKYKLFNLNVLVIFNRPYISNYRERGYTPSHTMMVPPPSPPLPLLLLLLLLVSPTLGWIEGFADHVASLQQGVSAAAPFVTFREHALPRHAVTDTWEDAVTCESKRVVTKIFWGGLHVVLENRLPGGPGFLAIGSLKKYFLIPLN